MDHHCVFLNNCVGQDNAPYFMRFLLWVATACAYVCSLASILAMSRMREKGVTFMQLARHSMHRGGAMGAYGYIPQAFIINNIVHGFITFASVPPPTPTLPALAPLRGRNFFDLLFLPILFAGSWHAFALCHVTPSSILGAPDEALVLQSLLQVCGYGTMCLLILSGLTCTVISVLLFYHLTLAWYGKTQLEYGFGIDPGPATARGWAGICEAFGARGIGNNWWWIAVLAPLPYRRGGHGGRRGDKSR